MRGDPFTITAAEAVNRGHQMAPAGKHACFPPLHVLNALLREHNRGASGRCSPRPAPSLDWPLNSAPAPITTGRQSGHACHSRSAALPAT